MRFRCHGGRKRIVAPDGSELAPATEPQPDGTLIKALARAWRWQRMLDDGECASVSDIGEAEGIEGLRQPGPTLGASGAGYYGGDHGGAD